MKRNDPGVVHHPTVRPQQKQRRSKRLATSSTPAGKLAALMHQATCVVFVTGAGISTNARIRDYRGPNGIWTEAAKSGLSETEASLNMVWDDSLYQSIPAAAPTLVHRSMAALVEADKVTFVISQNEDGLHIRAGHPRSRLAELHGLPICSCSS